MALELEKDTHSAVWSGVYDVVNIAQTDLFLEMGDLRKIGSAPILVGKMDYGVDFMVNQLIQRVKQSGSIDLLRIHGHGVAGLQTISCGMKLQKRALPSLRSIISTYNFEHIQSCLARLRGLFAPNAEVWLMGCDVGANTQGKILLDKLSKLWNVRTKAGKVTQYGGGIDTFGLEGEINMVSR